MECGVALFKPRIHLFACTHPSVSNSLDCNDWFAYKHQLPALSKPFELWILVCVHASVSQPGLSNTFGWGFPCLPIIVCLQPCVSPVLCSNTFGFWFLFCVHAPITSPLFQTRLFVTACSLEPKWLTVDMDHSM